MSNITLVTALFDIKRGEMDTDFKRPYSQYLEHFGKLLRACKNTPMLVYVDKSDEQFVRDNRIESVGTEIRYKTADDFTKWFPFYDKVSKIRTDSNWYKQAGWLENSTQAKLDLYNPLVMSKMFMLNDAVLFNPFDTDYYCWIDAGLTQTVHSGYFSHDNVLEKIEPLLNKFLFICYPYVGSNEIHGFERKAIARFSGVEYVDRVARGGFFGGHKNNISEMNGEYYHTLQRSLDAGLMGTEESVFSILTYQCKDRINIEMIDGNGMVSTFFERVKNMPIPAKDYTIAKSGVPENVAYYQSEEEVALNKDGTGVVLYIVTFNSPPQLEILLSSIKKSNPEILGVNRKVLIDNSSDIGTVSEYNRIASENGFELIRKGNMGICGARQWAAQDFHGGRERYMIWFEDDMLLVGDIKMCKNGLNMHVNNFLEKSIKIVEREKLDFLKFSFSEFYGDHHKQWAWHNVPQDVRNKFFPDGTCRMSWDQSGCVDGLSYLIGQVYYSNWPSIMTKAGNKKIFLDIKYAHPHEQTWMSQCFQLGKKGRIRSAVLMSSLINHDRTYHYSKDIRKES